MLLFEKIRFFPCSRQFFYFALKKAGAQINEHTNYKKNVHKQHLIQNCIHHSSFIDISTVFSILKLNFHEPVVVVVVVVFNTVETRRDGRTTGTHG
jgi:hypothetical protein